LEGEILKFRYRLSSIVSDHFDILLTGVQDYDMGETGVVPDAEYHHHYNHAHHHTQRRQVAGSVGGESQSAGLGIIIRCLCRWFPHDLWLCNEGDEMGMAAEKDIFSFPGAVAVKREQEGGHHGLHYAAGNQQNPLLHCPLSPLLKTSISTSRMDYGAISHFPPESVQGPGHSREQQRLPVNSQDSQETNLQALVETLRTELEISDLIMALANLRENIVAHHSQSS